MLRLLEATQYNSGALSVGRLPDNGAVVGTLRGDVVQRDQGLLANAQTCITAASAQHLDLGASNQNQRVR